MALFGFKIGFEIGFVPGRRPGGVLRDGYCVLGGGRRSGGGKLAFGGTPAQRTGLNTADADASAMGLGE
jgi:hypothetical protein